MSVSKFTSWAGRGVLGLALVLTMMAAAPAPAQAHGGHGYHHGGHYHKYKRKRRNRNVALGVIGGVLALGTIAALSNNRRYYDRGPRYYRGGGGSCDYWANQCARNWGTRNNNFYGCMRYHRCY